MRTTLSALAVAAAIGIATPALADVGSFGSMQRATLVARDVGVVGVQEVLYIDGKWEFIGRDVSGKNVTVYIDALTGAVVSVNRFW